MKYQCSRYLELTVLQPSEKIITIQQNFNGSNTDGSFTRAVSNSFLSPLETNSIAADLGKFREIENGMLCILVRIALMRRF